MKAEGTPGSVVAVVATIALSSVPKVLVDRDRPHFDDAVAHAVGQSYPSGHALTSLVTAAVLVLVCGRRARRWVAAVGGVVVAAVGLSRLVLGVHYLSDVVGGWALGAAWVCLLVLLLPGARTDGAPPAQE